MIQGHAKQHLQFFFTVACAADTTKPSNKTIPVTDVRFQASAECHDESDRACGDECDDKCDDACCIQIKHILTKDVAYYVRKYFISLN